MLRGTEALERRLVIALPLLLVFLCQVSTSAGAENKVDFAREVRPILSKKCLACHGPDDEHRQANLRLDTRDGALAAADSGAAAVVPGKPEESEILRRILSHDEAEKMPPPETSITLDEKQIEILRKWIAEGASYAPHWSFVKPVAPTLPEAANSKWNAHPIDRLVFAELIRAGLAPADEADRYTLIRRLSFDLRGLPPTPAEIEAFVKDTSDNAYEQLVNRFLADPAFGERWARMWMDQARYADSRGYGSDPLRMNIWPFRDWVIDAFNQNKPYDQFTLEQLAGDLMPGATDATRTATAFHRNTMTNTEGGTDDEEFRVAAVKDRVDTTMQVWMGVTAGCAKCHNHKYDPISQKEYYQLYAVFNQTADSDRGDEAPLLSISTSDYEESLKRTQERIAQLKAKLATPSDELTKAQQLWESSLVVQGNWQPITPTEITSTAGLKFTTNADATVEAQPVDGKYPASDDYTIGLKLDASDITALKLEAIAVADSGAGTGEKGQLAISQIGLSFAKEGAAPTIAPRFVRVELPGAQKMLLLAEVQVFSGEKNVARSGKATQSSTDYDGPPQLAIDGNTDGHYANAKSTTHTAVENNPWWEVDLQSAIDVSKVVIWNRTDGNVGGRIAGAKLVLLDANREVLWQQPLAAVPNPSLDVTIDGISSVNLVAVSAEPVATSLSAAAVLAPVIDRAKAWIVGESNAGASLTLYPAASIHVKAEAKLVLSIRQQSTRAGELLKRFRISVTRDPAMLLRSKVPAEVLAIIDQPAAQRNAEDAAKLAAHFRSISPLLDTVRQELAAAEKQVPAKPTVPVMQELAPNKRRVTHLMLKGNFLAKGDAVEPQLPLSFHAAPKESVDRLKLAEWIISPENPLTARVAVNRFWAQLFGIGIVETEEDFGLQGDLPSHPQLLDWLAIEFVRLDWDTKQLLKTMVMSQTYRQSSQTTPEKLEKDARNRLFSRGPRFRLEAEMVRDQALQLAGLLSHKMKGPSVFPPQPAGLWQAAFNGERTWTTSVGEDKYRRGLYTFWRRTTPYPSMTTFDAPSRETCSLRRVRTNTPLQAFVTMNDVVYVEASQALARRLVREGGDTPTARAKFGLELCLARPATDAQVQVIVKLYESELAHYKTDAAAAAKLATDPLGPLPEGADAAEYAAWTVIANVLLNMDAVLMKG